jgi:hypothetical protein
LGRREPSDKAGPLPSRLTLHVRQGLWHSMTTCLHRQQSHLFHHRTPRPRETIHDKQTGPDDSPRSHSRTHHSHRRCSRRSTSRNKPRRCRRRRHLRYCSHRAARQRATAHPHRASYWNVSSSSFWRPCRAGRTRSSTRRPCSCLSGEGSLRSDTPRLRQCRRCWWCWTRFRRRWAWRRGTRG